MLSCKIPVPAVQPPVGAPGHQEHRRTHKWNIVPVVSRRGQVKADGLPYVTLTYFCDDCQARWVTTPLYPPRPGAQPNLGKAVS